MLDVCFTREETGIHNKLSVALCYNTGERSRMRCVSRTQSQDIETRVVHLSQWTIIYSTFVMALRQHKTFTWEKDLPSTARHMVCTIEEELHCLPPKSIDLPFLQMQCPRLYVSKTFVECKPAGGQQHRAERRRLQEYFWEEKLNYHYYQIHLQPSFVPQTTNTHSNSKQRQSRVIRKYKKYPPNSSAVCLHDLRQKL